MREAPLMRLTRVRWIVFMAVGTIGFIAQLAALWALTNRLGFHYLLATAVATELAILLNFLGHECWTWADRPGGPIEAVARLLRFNLTNGAISLAGGLVIMPVLIEMGRVNYLLANVVAVGVCSVANFIAADRIVFRPAFCLSLTLLLLGVSGSPAEGAEQSVS